LALQRHEVDSPVGRRIRRQPATRFLQLALATDLVPAAGLVPGDGDVYEALEEVTFAGLGRAPGILQLFVGGEVLAVADQREAALERLSGRL
jgi:hypothetical protein